MSRVIMNAELSSCSAGLVSGDQLGLLTGGEATGDSPHGTYCWLALGTSGCLVDDLYCSTEAVGGPKIF